MPVRIHPTADVSSCAVIGEGSSIWHQAQVREGAIIGQNCIIGKGVYIDAGVQIGSNVKIQNYVSVFHGVTLEDGVFVGPHVCFTNDMRPRAITEQLDLLRPIYQKTAAYGHFGRELPEFTWEKTDKVELLKQKAGL